MTRAAEASADSARTDRVIDRPTAGGWHIRASWPPPMMPTTGNPPGARCGAVTTGAYPGNLSPGPVSAARLVVCSQMDLRCSVVHAGRWTSSSARCSSSAWSEPWRSSSTWGATTSWCSAHTCWGSTTSPSPSSDHLGDSGVAGGLGRQPDVDLPPPSQPAGQPRARAVPVVQRRRHGHLGRLPGHIPVRLGPGHPACRQRHEHLRDRARHAVPFLVVPQVGIRRSPRGGPAGPALRDAPAEPDRAELDGAELDDPARLDHSARNV